jgi:hypothetical protein
MIVWMERTVKREHGQRYQQQARSVAPKGNLGQVALLERRSREALGNRRSAQDALDGSHAA